MGDIRLDKTLAELNINDTPPLTEQERSATVEHLLQSTSGIYHSALYEVGSWKRNKPERGTHQPGETWYYNNWDFNALGTIFEQETGKEIGPAFYEEIARPIGMQDFTAEDVVYSRKGDFSEKIMGNESDHPAYMFSMSARDLARYGLLYLNKGQWNDRQVVPESWIEKSWRPVDISMFETLKFGYLWWQFEDGFVYQNDNLGFEHTIYYTSGNRGHMLFVIPYLDLVVVHRVYTKGIDFWSQMNRGMFGNYAEVDRNEIYGMLEMIREAHPDYR
jgi:CubicO group peptidase (beta-lactamase class C family)